jgi:hypothetical protein
MNIGSIPQQAFPCYGYAMSAVGNGRKSFPVAPGLVIYSQLKHISGTPAPEGTQGISISRLRILDTMIEQLSQMRGKPSIDLGSLDGSNESRINTLIEQHHQQIRTAQSASFYTPAAPAIGTLLNIAV